MALYREGGSPLNPAAGRRPCSAKRQRSTSTSCSSEAPKASLRMIKPRRADRGIRLKVRCSAWSTLGAWVEPTSPSSISMMLVASIWAHFNRTTNMWQEHRQKFAYLLKNIKNQTRRFLSFTFGFSMFTHVCHLASDFHAQCNCQLQTLCVHRCFAAAAI